MVEQRVDQSLHTEYQGEDYRKLAINNEVGGQVNSTVTQPKSSHPPPARPITGPEIKEFLFSEACFKIFQIR